MEKFITDGKVTYRVEAVRNQKLNRKPRVYGAFRKDETAMRVRIDIRFTATGQTVEITVEPPT